MCGIFGYVGRKNKSVVKLALEGLKSLEYRGYDSAGIAGLKGEEVLCSKRVGKIKALEEALEKNPLDLDCVIAHTRWATHGGLTQENAHPHLDEAGTLAVVHNGIVENHEEVRAELIAAGVHFVSETDSEVIAQLIAFFYRGEVLAAVQEAMAQLEGSLAIAVVHRDHPDQIIAAGRESPLAIGVGNGEAFLASDTHAFLVHTREVIFLDHGEVAVLHPKSVEVYDQTCAQVLKTRERLSHSRGDANKGDYPHYTLKEIHEQPQTIRNAFLSRFSEDLGTATLEGIETVFPDLSEINRILILGCGTSYHAAAVAALFFEETARIPTQIEIASEFRYKNPIIQKNTLVLAISQSGETLDTLAAVREAQAKGARVLAICNVQGSTLTRMADHTLFLRAGPEIGVASTKAFTSQLSVLYLLGIHLARLHHLSQQEGLEYLAALRVLPMQVKAVLRDEERIKEIALRFAQYEHFFFLGRHYMLPTCMEGALKLKEIAYVNANGYPGGELKHGPIALISEECPTIAYCSNEGVYEKLLSNLMEIRARKGPVVAITYQGSKGLGKITDDVIEIPKTLDVFAPVLATAVSQLLAYHIADARGTEIDQPRNLAKSVTVE